MSPLPLSCRTTWGTLKHRVLISWLLLVCADGRAADTAAAKLTIHWAKNHAPPFYIDEGADAGAGFADGVQNFLEQALPQFEHQTVYVPLPRLNDFWDKGANYCFASMIHEPLPADSSYVLSQPNVYYLPHGVITRRDFEATANATRVSLRHLLAQPELVLGLIGNRSFGPTIDELMARHHEATSRFVRRDRDGLRGLLHMLLLERIDYLIDYAFVFDYYSKQEPYSGQIQFVAIEETGNPGLLGAVGCTNNAWGNAVIEQIDHASAQLLQSPYYRSFVSRWQAVAMDHDQYWHRFLTERERLLTAQVSQ